MEGKGLPSMPSSIPSRAQTGARASVSPFLEFLFFISVLGLLAFFFLFPEQKHPQQHHFGKQLHVLVGGFFVFGAS